MSFEKWLINRLLAHGAYSGKADAAYGREAIAALKRFQKAVGLKTNGLADDVTVEALRKPATSPRFDAVIDPAPVIPAEPVWMREAMRFAGLAEISGEKSNPTIMGWAKRLGGWVAGFYTNDDIPWCGLAMAHWIGVTLPKEPLPSNVLSALAWVKFGEFIYEPSLGAIMVFVRPGGGHVGLYQGEDATHYHILGGNQQNAVNVTRIAKDRCIAKRWPKTAPLPPAGPVKVSASGVKISRNEA
ncbi:TIGR02594 family protein [Rhizobium sp. CFBP 8762]|uniref:NlpC/P60 family protein n=1 Tax=Rhizobium sp. CFBP 8762 TaxID=2775279 RepID=UPI0017847494|nr:TIGR02594 family protein [Rhizobium sp. CFBP 8762]MBD8554901.1 TIGR02594 family protein [Rhizobium sp. CFBP 8762]